MNSIAYIQKSKSNHWGTPKHILEQYKDWFDPCPYPRPTWDGLTVDWLSHEKIFCNPPYNNIKLNDFNWTIEMALAGFNKKDIEVLYSDNQLTIKSIFEKDEDDAEDITTIHRGISKRQFKKAFTLADEVVINGAELKDGMLIVDLEKIVPEEKKPRTIKIS